ncbi:MAG: EamA family transporter [Synergistales bacterium]
MENKPSRFSILAAYAAIYFIWGSTYLGIRFTVETMPPFLSGGLRFLAAGAALFAWGWIRGTERPTRSGWVNAAKLAAIMILLGYGGVMWAEQVVPSGIAALIISVEPLWFFVLDWLVFKSARPRLREWAGLALGFAGTLYLALGEGGADFEAVPGYRIGTLVIFCSTLAWVSGSLASRKTHIADSTSLGTGMEMLMGGVFLVAAGIGLGEGARFVIGEISTKSWLALAYLSLFGSFIAFTAFVWLLKVEPASRVATHAFVNPVVAVILGWMLGGEQITSRMLVAACVIVASVMLITLSKKEPGVRA